MFRALTRLALATAVPAALALPTASAQAVTVPGCFGASTVLVCDLTVTVTAPQVVETYETTVPVCVSTCVDVPVTLARSAPGAPGSICVTYENRAGAVVFTNCRQLVVPPIPPIPDVDVNELTDEVMEIVVREMWEALCRISVFENNPQCW